MAPHKAHLAPHFIMSHMAFARRKHGDIDKLVIVKNNIMFSRLREHKRSICFDEENLHRKEEGVLNQL